MNIFKEILIDFNSKGKKEERLLEINDTLNELEVTKDFLSNEFNIFRKSIDSDQCSINFIEARDSFIASYPKEMSSIKLKEKRLNEEKNYIEKSLIKGCKNKDIYKSLDIIKSFYKQGKIGLKTYNKAIEQITKDKKIKYADICVLNMKGELLLVKRSNYDTSNAGAWVIPGGHIDIGEDCETAAKRELLEEAGISVDNLLREENVLKPLWSKVGEFEDENVHIHYFCLSNVRNDIEILLQEEEMREYCWIDRMVIDNYPMVFNMKDNIKKVLYWNEVPQISIIEKAYNLGYIDEDTFEKAKSHKYISKKPDGKGGFEYKYREDREGNEIGSGDYNIEPTIFDFKEYPEISHTVNNSGTTESTYVRYFNKNNEKFITVRFSNHISNAVKFGDQLDGNSTTKNEVLYHLGLKDREFISDKRLFIGTRQVSNKDLEEGKYEVADKTIKELYDLGKDADLSKYENKIAKDSRYLITDNKVKEVEDNGVDFLGNKTTRGKYIYKDIQKSEISKNIEDIDKIDSNMIIGSQTVNKEHIEFLKILYNKNEKEKNGFLINIRTNMFSVEDVLNKYLHLNYVPIDDVIELINNNIGINYNIFKELVIELNNKYNYDEGVDINTFEKSLKGIYSNSSENIKLGRVGKKYDYSLSAYTIADNCSDISDCEAGVEDLREYFNKEQNPTKTAYIRLYKLKEKINKFRKENYGRISEQADRIISGEEYIERLSPSEEQGRVRGGKRNVEATLLLRGTEVTSSEDGSGIEELVNEQEKILKDYAKENNLWVESEIIDKDWLFIDKGEEAKIYRFSDDGKFINKVYDYQMMSLSPLEFIDNRISLHNFMFEETAYELVGFTETKRGLSFILKQPYIRDYKKTSVDIISEDMIKRGFKQLDKKSYYNENYIVEDLHSKNVLTSEKTGKLYFIDTVVSLNEKGEGYGGERVYDKIEVKTNSKKIEKSFNKISELYLKGQISDELFEKAELNYFEKGFSDSGLSKVAQIGEIRVRKDGTKWKKISSTGSKDDWKQVTDSKKNKKQEEDKQSNNKTEDIKEDFTPKEITEAAKTTTQKALEIAIKESKEPEIRTAAQLELDRRKKEEVVQEDDESKKTEGNKKESKVKNKDNNIKKGYESWL